MAKGIARYYDASKNPGGHLSFSGVPQGDITEEWWEGLPDHLKASIDAHEMYRKTPVPRPKKEKDDGEDDSSEAVDDSNKSAEEDAPDEGASEEKESEQGSEGGN